MKEGITQLARHFINYYVRVLNGVLKEIYYKITKEKVFQFFFF